MADPAHFDAQSHGSADEGAARLLHLSQILVGLGAYAVPAPAEVATQAPPEPPENLTAKQRRKWRKRHRATLRTNLTVGQIVDRAQHAGFGFIIAFLTLLAAAIPIGGPLGWIIGFVGIQMMIGMNRPWLPQRLRRYAVSMRTLDWITQKLVRWTRGMEKLVRPRFTFMTRGPFWGAIGAGFLLMGIGLAIPMPATNYLFIVPLMIYAMGMLEDDGLLIMLGHAISTLLIVAAIFAWETVSTHLGEYWPWLNNLL